MSQERAPEAGVGIRDVTKEVGSASAGKEHVVGRGVQVKRKKADRVKGGLGSSLLV